MSPTHQTVVRCVTLATVTMFLAVLGWHLGQPGYTHTRGVVFALLGGLALTGASGVVAHRDWIAASSATGLLLVGLWQAVLWLYIIPVAAILVGGAVVTAEQPTADTPAPE